MLKVNTRKENQHYVSPIFGLATEHYIRTSNPTLVGMKYF